MRGSSKLMCGSGCQLHLHRDHHEGRYIFQKLSCLMTTFKFQSVLPQQKWSSSVSGPSNEITVRSRTHYLASKRTITSAGLSRPESRAATSAGLSRPQSRASAGPSRPQSRGPEDRVRSASLGHRKKEEVVSLTAVKC